MDNQYSAKQAAALDILLRALDDARPGSKPTASELSTAALTSAFTGSTAFESVESHPISSEPVGVRLRPYYRLRRPSDIPEGAKTPKRPSFSPLTPPEAASPEPFLIIKRAADDDGTSLSPTSAPKIKRCRNMPLVPDSDSDEQPERNDTRGEDIKGKASVRDPFEAGKFEVQMSVASGLPPKEVVSPSKYDLSELDTSLKCRRILIRDFLTEILAAGFDENVKIFAYRFQNLHHVQNSTLEDEQDAWLTATNDSPASFRKWSDDVKDATGDEVLPHIQVLIVADGAVEATGQEEPLLTRREKQAAGRDTPMNKPEQEGMPAQTQTVEAKTTRSTKKAALKQQEASEGEEETVPTRTAIRKRAVSATVISQKDAVAAFAKIKELKAANKKLQASSMRLEKDKAELTAENVELKRYPGAYINDLKIRNLEAQLASAAAFRQNAEVIERVLTQKVEQRDQNYKLLLDNYKLLFKNYQRADKDNKMLTDSLEKLARSDINQTSRNQKAIADQTLLASRMAHDLENACAGVNPRDRLPPAEEAYWAIYLSGAATVTAAAAAVDAAEDADVEGDAEDADDDGAEVDE